MAILWPLAERLRHKTLRSHIGDCLSPDEGRMCVLREMGVPCCILLLHSQHSAKTVECSPLQNVALTLLSFLSSCFSLSLSSLLFSALSSRVFILSLVLLFLFVTVPFFSFPPFLIFLSSSSLSFYSFLQFSVSIFLFLPLSCRPTWIALPPSLSFSVFVSLCHFDNLFFLNLDKIVLSQHLGIHEELPFLYLSCSFSLSLPSYSSFLPLSLSLSCPLLLRFSLCPPTFPSSFSFLLVPPSLFLSLSLLLPPSFPLSSLSQISRSPSLFSLSLPLYPERHENLKPSCFPCTCRKQTQSRRRAAMEIDFPLPLLHCSVQWYRPSGCIQVPHALSEHI